MSNWNHPQCLECWEREQGDRIPVRVVGDEPKACCWCGKPTDGIYVREDPTVIRNHPEHD